MYFSSLRLQATSILSSSQTPVGPIYTHNKFAAWRYVYKDNGLKDAWKITLVKGRLRCLHGCSEFSQCMICLGVQVLWVCALFGAVHPWALRRRLWRRARYPLLIATHLSLQLRLNCFCSSLGWRPISNICLVFNVWVVLKKWSHGLRSMFCSATIPPTLLMTIAQNLFRWLFWNSSSHRPHAIQTNVAKCVPKMSLEWTKTKIKLIRQMCTEVFKGARFWKYWARLENVWAYIAGHYKGHAARKSDKPSKETRLSLYHSCFSAILAKTGS